MSELALFDLPVAKAAPPRKRAPGQNTSPAVMNQRKEPADSLDFFPTPPFATRALCEYGLKPYHGDLKRASVWEPACGDGAMAKPLGEYFGDVRATDIHAYGYGEQHDFLLGLTGAPPPRWIITNPPFNLAQRFAEIALAIARCGVALLVRTNFLESQARYPLPAAPSGADLPVCRARRDGEGTPGPEGVDRDLLLLGGVDEGAGMRHGVRVDPAV